MCDRYKRIFAIKSDAKRLMDCRSFSAVVVIISGTRPVVPPKLIANQLIFNFRLTSGLILNGFKQNSQ